jgi:hypothetical protein
LVSRKVSRKLLRTITYGSKYEPKAAVAMKQPPPPPPPPLTALSGVVGREGKTVRVSGCVAVLPAESVT